MGGLAGAAVFTRAIDEAQEAALVMAQTRAVIKSTGGAAGYTADQIADMAGQLSKQTRFSDDTIQSTTNLLLTFTKINKTLPDATELVLDMATALKTDTKSAALQVGKALNNLDLNALIRSGVSFTAQQQRQFTALVRSGKALEAQKFILAELRAEFGGSAKAAGEFAPIGERLGKVFNNILETVGGALLPALNGFENIVIGLLDGLGPLAPVLIGVAGAIGLVTLAAGPLGAVLGIILSPLGAIVLAVGALAAAFATDFMGVRTTVEGVWNAIQGPISSIKNAVSNLFAGIFADITAPSAADVRFSKKMGEVLEPTIPLLDSLKKRIPQAMADIGTAIGDALKNLGIDTSAFKPITDLFAPGGGMEAIASGINNALSNLSGLDFSFVRTLLDAIGAGFGAFASAVGPAVQDVMKKVGGLLPDIAAAIKNVINDLSGKDFSGVKKLFEDIGAGLGAIASVVGGVIGAAIDKFKTILPDIVDGVKQFIENLGGADASGASTILQTVANALGVVGTVVTTAIIGTLDGLAKGLPLFGKAIADFISGISAIGQGDPGAALTKLGDGLFNIANGILQIPLDIATRLGGLLNIDVAGGLKAWEGIRDNVGAIIDRLLQGALQLGKDAVQGIQDFLAGVQKAADPILKAIGPIVNLFSELLNTLLGIPKAAAEALSSLGGPGPGQSTGTVGGGGGKVQAFGGHRASGGSVMSGRAYVVGENSPEIFVPGRSGGIYAPGGGSTYNIQVYVSGIMDAGAAINQIDKELARRNLPKLGAQK